MLNNIEPEVPAPKKDKDWDIKRDPNVINPKETPPEIDKDEIRKRPEIQLPNKEEEVHPGEEQVVSSYAETPSEEYIPLIEQDEKLPENYQDMDAPLVKP